MNILKAIAYEDFLLGGDEKFCPQAIATEKHCATFSKVQQVLLNQRFLSFTVSVVEPSCQEKHKEN